MRIIRTEVYYPPEEVSFAPSIGGKKGFQRRRRENVGIGIAWLSYAELQMLAPKGTVLFGDLPDFRVYTEFSASVDFGKMYAFLNACIQGASGRDFVDSGRYFSSTNSRLIEQLLETKVVVEESPVSEIPLRALLGKGANVAVGTYVGWKAAGDSSLLLLATVPAGIVIVGAAIGVSNALVRGLDKPIVQAIRRALR